MLFVFSSFLEIFLQEQFFQCVLFELQTLLSSLGRHSEWMETYKNLQKLQNQQMIAKETVSLNYTR